MNKSASCALALISWVGVTPAVTAQTTALVWSNDWPTYVLEVSKIIAGESAQGVAGEPNYVGKEVEWSGAVRAIQRPGPKEGNAHVNLEMPELPIAMGAFGAGKVNQIGLRPKPDEWKSWDKVSAGDRVVFRTTLASGVGGGNPTMERAAKVGVMIAIINGKGVALISADGGIFVRKSQLGTPTAASESRVLPTPALAPTPSTAPPNIARQARTTGNATPEGQATARVRALDIPFKLTEDQKQAAGSIFAAAIAARTGPTVATEAETQRLSDAIEKNDTAARGQSVANLGDLDGKLMAIEAKADASFYALVTADQKQWSQAVLRSRVIASLALDRAFLLTDGTPADPVQRVRHLSAQLSLAEDQKRNAVAIFVHGSNAAVEPRLASDAERAGLSAAIEKNDNDAIERSTDVLGGLASQVIGIAAEAEAAFYGLLNADQRAKYKSGTLSIPVDMLVAHPKDLRQTAGSAPKTTNADSIAELFSAVIARGDKALAGGESEQASATWSLVLSFDPNHSEAKKKLDALPGSAFSLGLTQKQVHRLGEIV